MNLIKDILISIIDSVLRMPRTFQSRGILGKGFNNWREKKQFVVIMNYLRSVMYVFF